MPDEYTYYAGWSTPSLKYVCTVHYWLNRAALTWWPVIHTLEAPDFIAASIFTVLGAIHCQFWSLSCIVLQNLERPSRNDGLGHRGLRPTLQSWILLATKRPRISTSPLTISKCTIALVFIVLVTLPIMHFVYVQEVSWKSFLFSTVRWKVSWCTILTAMWRNDLTPIRGALHLKVVGFGCNRNTPIDYESSVCQEYRQKLHTLFTQFQKVYSLNSLNLLIRSTSSAFCIALLFLRAPCR